MDCVDDVDNIFKSCYLLFLRLHTIHKKDDNSYCQCSNKITKFISEMGGKNCSSAKWKFSFYLDLQFVLLRKLLTISIILLLKLVLQWIVNVYFTYPRVLEK